MEDRLKKKLWDCNRKTFIEEFSILYTENENTYFERNPITKELTQLSTCHITEINCTGKRDENKELVFQDDFLASLDEDSYFIRIMWDKDLCKFYCAFWNDTDKYWEVHDESDEIIEKMHLYEVVSNIHEHPELLESEG